MDDFFRRLVGDPDSDFFFELFMTTKGGDGRINVSSERFSVAFGVACDTVVALSLVLEGEG